MSLPKGFLWGNSVSSMQYDGAQHEGGKGPSVYEDRGGVWEEAVDGYHRFRADDALMAQMGVRCLRFQTSWSRIMPEGEGAVNPEGLAYYEALVDDLLAQGITPMVCLYHFDMPLALARRYHGFASKHVIDAFVAYAKVVIDALAPKVGWWLSFNEQNLYGLPLAFGLAGAPDPADPLDPAHEPEVLQIFHNVMVAHARVANYLHDNYPQCRIGGMCAFTPVYPASPDPRDVWAATQAERMSDWVVLDTCATGSYPAYFTAYLRSRGITLDITPGEAADIARMRNDFASLSYYRSSCISSDKLDEGVPAGAWGWVGGVENPKIGSNEWGWGIDPVGYRRTLTEICERTGLPVFSLENGIGWRETLPADGSEVADDYRIDYHRAHIRALRDAVELDGARVIGYLGWGLIDIPSSSGDTEKRYGAVYVDYAAQGEDHLRRIPKKSFGWFRRVFLSNGEDLG